MSDILLSVGVDLSEISKARSQISKLLAGSRKSGFYKMKMKKHFVDPLIFLNFKFRGQKYVGYSFIGGG
ncbi:MAG: hypothetical protein A3K83_06600 [Omnitrophica WOR_2 bacterium RBG_13_44_8b]|nr:MAG: hypothetical protein A3K83_06600 [Omnitrophica WOR_2 bacterium RBG_13_44_8b]